MFKSISPLKKTTIPWEDMALTKLRQLLKYIEELVK